MTRMPLLLICLVLGFTNVNAQYYSTDMPINMVRTRDAVAPIQDLNDYLLKLDRDVKMSTQYFDGLGRPLQTVLRKKSPMGKDVINANSYDELGRESEKFLPFTSQAATGELNLDPFRDQYSFYNTYLAGQNENHFYSKTIFDANPEYRPVKNMPPGISWVGNNRGTEINYFNNTVNDVVQIFDVQDEPLGEFGIYSSPGRYVQATLLKLITSDEQGNQVIEFKNKSGQLILKKVQLTASPDDGSGTDYNGWLCTYYIYDKIGRLRAVLPPKATNLYLNGGFTNEMLEELCFRYEYDLRNRMIVKQVPGAKPVFMVYDKKDRLVLTQDGNQKELGKWQYILFDNLNRIIETGIWDNNNSWSQIYNIAKDKPTYPDLSGRIYEVLTKNYYDNYSGIVNAISTIFYPNFHSQDISEFYTAYNQFPYPRALEPAPIIKGKLAGTMTRILGTNNFLYSIIYYDNRGRVIQQQTSNELGGVDIYTTQYTFSGQVLMNVHRHNKTGTSSETIIVYTKLIYDEGGRLIRLQKKISNNLGIVKDWKTISMLGYDELEQLKTKELAVTETSCNPSGPEACLQNTYTALTKLDYEYNIRGWLLGINKQFVQSTSVNDPGNFGFELAYDKPASVFTGSTYTQPAFNGNIAGTTWKMKGDGVQRKYDFGYDNVNRLMKADFQQYEDNSWSNSRINYDMKMGDGYDPLSAYDENGNILRMQQWGFKIGASPNTQIDDLLYSYLDNNTSNKLEKVTDTYSDNLTKLGDFKDGHNQAEDYTYDFNGNLIKDENKNITEIKYNHLNLPKQIIITGKGSIDYVYDAAGNKLKKIVHETGKPDKTTTYIGGFVYEDDVLQFVSHEEGRIRYKADGATADNTFLFDYFIKDHLGNIRVVLTEEQKVDKYPVASLEDEKLSTEEVYYNIDVSKIVTASSLQSNAPPAYINDNGIGNNPEDATFSNANSQKLYKLNSNTNKTGLGITLKVMAGDKIDVLGSSYYYTNNTGGNSSDNPVTILDLLNGFLNSPGAAASTGLHGAVTPATINTPVNTGIISAMFEDQTSETEPNSQKPRAYINYLFFDEQFKCVKSGFSKVGNPSEVKAHFQELQNLTATKNGFVYIYCSNESQVDVFFDNLQVVHTRGPILEETSYYPFGLVMQGISSKAAGTVENKYKYNGKELQSKEFMDGSGLELNDYGKRMQDPQLGRWWVLDPKADLLEMSSPYVFCYNNPIIYKDPDGELAILINGRVTGESQRGNASYWDNGIIEAIKSSGIPNSSNMMFVDGDRYYNHVLRHDFDRAGEEGVKNGGYLDGNYPSERKEAGYTIGKQEFQNILSKLAKDPSTGKIIEKIQIYTHSRGAAFGAGYIDALLEMIKQNADKFADPNSVIDLVYNMAPHQSNSIDEPGGLNAYSQDHTKDPLSGNDMGGLKGAFTSNENSPGMLGSHSTSSFVKDITAFTKSFAANGNNSQQLINDFIKKMQDDYGIKVTVKQ